MDVVQIYCNNLMTVYTFNAMHLFIHSFISEQLLNRYTDLVKHCGTRRVVGLLPQCCFQFVQWRSDKCQL